MIKHLLPLCAAIFIGTSFAHAQPAAGVTRVPVLLSGGYETEPQDRGRPVVLIASALGVKSEVFREAFSHVHPAGPGSGGPTDAEARQNKAALMKALGKYGISNDRLDTVSNYYRYPPGRDSLWKVSAATAVALVKDGKVIGYEITNNGYGYSSVPTVSVPGYPAARGQVTLAFSKQFNTNGALTAITLPMTKTP